jgi:CRP/FNR family cyclic AMP-dependent transcriptional regulator
MVTAGLLAEIPLFSAMDEEERSKLRSLMTEHLFQPGQMIMKAGESGGTFQVIEQGEVELWLTDTKGKKVILDVLGPGKFFGELSMLAGETRSASATPEEKVITLELSRTDFFHFLHRRPDAAIDVLTVLGDQLKHTDDILRTRVSRNPNDALDERLSIGQRVADGIAAFSGSIPFLLINLIVFMFWIVVNTVGPGRLQFDAFPFQFLTMAVSLEAIFLSIFVLVSQNRQATKDRINADLDYEVNVKAEMELSVMTSQMREMEGTLHHIHRDF